MDGQVGRMNARGKRTHSEMLFDLFIKLSCRVITFDGYCYIGRTGAGSAIWPQRMQMNRILKQTNK